MSKHVKRIIKAVLVFVALYVLFHLFAPTIFHNADKSNNIVSQESKK